MLRRLQPFAFGVLGVVVALVCGVAAQTGQVVFPEAEGRSTLMELCGGCHDVRATVEKRKTQKDWKTSVADMRAKGASATDDEAKVIAAYMTRYFGLVNVNKAGAEEMQAVLGVSEKEAGAIVGYRDAHGAFATLDDLKRVDGIDAEKLEREKASIVFSGS
ncbi:MAG: helix-hairpin-helix domain-containing protein [Acidobacteria bacterium]|nr:helix-hairpin-helix domain-containing protein [Acidobacteriota bacterium]